MMLSKIHIDDEYVLTHGLTGEDLDSLVKHINDKEVSSTLLRVPYPYSRSDAERFKAFMEKKEEECGKPMSWQIRNSGNEVIGSISFHNCYGKDSHKDEIGYWLGKAYWGKGIMAKAIKVFAAMAFENSNIVRIEATIFDFNSASQRMIEKCGFNCEGTLKKAYFKDGKYIDGKLYSLVK